ncbi:putative glutathione-specific gamma-glutamylcyclotransferase 2 isoform X2 [Corticium candelabrum]|uniref:putative glutathione-specific gamma-glutamylcyclotransferase 2 isoform X2 n=1 Tax=Corticium candelabrum TaxID=121492 RepID=UPI002E252759|nr:putative glutathione-specific gamma-glutamylcyclotransferase 2 isoform X2 [Corticium candelabrum]
MWVFGYGSLTWNVDFPYEDRCVGYVEGFARRFWQGSIDHRGVPDAEHIWGIAYKLAEHQVAEVMSHLDHREKCGYETREMLFHPKDTLLQPFQVTAYSASSDNPWYLGPAPLEDMATEIATRCGPSGRNAEYLLKLAESMRSIAPHHHDDHLYTLEEKVKRILCLNDDDD